MGVDVVPAQQIESAIYLIRGMKVMLDSDLAVLYGVKTKELNKAVTRNRDRFPSDFVFQLTAEEVANLRFQIGTSSSSYGGRRYRPFAFTEQGVAMLSGVLKSQRAIQVHVAIMRAFVRLRSLLAAHHELADKLAELEKRVTNSEEGIQSLFDAIRQLMMPLDPPKKQIGFHVREKRATYGRKR
jgi:hypothetical protein